MQVIQALEQISAHRGDGVAIVAVRHQPCRAQLFDPGVQRVGGNQAHAILQQAEGLRVTVFQRPEHANTVA